MTAGQHNPGSDQRRRRNGAGFTLIELLVTIAIIGVLLSLLLPAVRNALGATRGFKCKLSQRSVAFDFSVFADNELHGSRGDDDQLAKGHFRLETFQESEYQVDEFWNWGGDNQVELPDAAGNDPMRCPEVRGTMVLRRNMACTQGAIDPPESISFGFNVRLHIAEVAAPGGGTRQTSVQLTSAILQQTDVPLFWDVDGSQATQFDMWPVFSGPSLDSPGVFANDRYWFPGMRHNGRANFAFIDGHVEESRTPLQEAAWNWGYQPPVR
jgi:prepilin-type processing-associated H-X9-DG protein/prepilin-type N-terminal cleavage/methylation domain-containing protein